MLDVVATTPSRPFEGCAVVKLDMETSHQSSRFRWLHGGSDVRDPTNFYTLNCLTFPTASWLSEVTVGILPPRRFQPDQIHLSPVNPFNQKNLTLYEMLHSRHESNRKIGALASKVLPLLIFFGQVASSKSFSLVHPMVHSSEEKWFSTII